MKHTAPFGVHATSLCYGVCNHSRMTTVSRGSFNKEIRSIAYVFGYFSLKDGGKDGGSVPTCSRW